MRLICRAVVAAMVALAPVMSLSGGQIAGKLLDPAGGTIPGATAGLTREGEVVRLREARTDETGRFSFTALEPGTYRISFQAPGFATKEISQTVTSEGRVLLPDVVLKIGSLGPCDPWNVERPIVRFVQIGSGAELTGSVGLRDGPTLEGGSVMLTGERGTYSAISTADGAFQFTRVTPGIYTLRVKIPGYADFLMEAVEIRELNRTEIRDRLDLRSCPPEIECEPVTKVRKYNHGSCL